MTMEQGTATTRKLPGVFKAAISVGIAFHLLALGAVALSVQGGPWWLSYLRGSSPSLPPQFASSIAEFTTPYYLQPLMLANNYHFNSNAPGSQTIYLQVAGPTRNKSVKFPDARANLWVRNRQRLLVQGLGSDQNYQAPQTEGVFVGDQPEIAFYWHPLEAVQHKLSMHMRDTQYPTRDDFLRDLAQDLSEDELDRYREVILAAAEGSQPKYRLTDMAIKSLSQSHPDALAKTFTLYQLKVNSVPKGPMYFTPSPAASILIRSYARYLERQRGEPVQLVRLFRNPMGPAVMFPSPLDPSKLLIDAPNYDLDIVTHNLGNGTPKRWSPK